MGCTFFFGAGAESAYKIGVGASFVGPLLRAEYEKERKALLGSARGGYRLIYHGSQNIFLQTIVENEKDAKKVFGPKTVDICKQYYEEKGDGKDEITALCKKWYEIITSKDTHSKEDEQIDKFFQENGVFFSSLDEKFNSLRKLPFDIRANRVINAYVTIFIQMIKSVYNIPENFEWNYPNVFDLIQSNDYKVDFDTNSYYKELSKLLDNETKEQEKIFIATTNYTKIVEEVTKKSDIAYLHGKLEWFEDAQNLTVYDCTCNDERELAEKNIDSIFPFVLIPSGVKPIICRKQIDQYGTFIKQLDQSNILFVFGYKFNSEDNHVNSLIGEWLRQTEHRMVYLNFRDSLDWNSIYWAKSFKKNSEDAPIVTREKMRKFLSGEAKIFDIVADTEKKALTFFSMVCKFLGREEA